MAQREGTSMGKEPGERILEERIPDTQTYTRTQFHTGFEHMRRPQSASALLSPLATASGTAGAPRTDRDSHTSHSIRRREMDSEDEHEKNLRGPRLKERTSRPPTVQPSTSPHSSLSPASGAFQHAPLSPTFAEKKFPWKKKRKTTTTTRTAEAANSIEED